MANSKCIASPIVETKYKDCITNVLKLVKDNVSQDTIETLEYLLYQAKRGQLIGLVYGAQMKNRSCIVDGTGEAYRNPLFALGMASFLTHELALRAGNEDE